MIIDTHCHPYLNKQKSQKEVINNFFEKGWEKMIVIWTNLNSSSKAIEIAYSREWIYCSIWIHPCDVFDLDLESSLVKLENLLLQNKDKIVAIWECWLDYYRIERDEKIVELKWESKQKSITLKKKLQELFFKAQISLAREYNLPIIIHNRDSKEDVLKILKETDFKNFIFHCYSEDLEYAKKLIEFAPECKLSFSWIVTFKNAQGVQETVKNIDIKHILAETDSPYLTPTPLRWKEENEPIFTKYVINFISELRWEDCKEKIYENSKNIFKLDNKN